MDASLAIAVPQKLPELNLSGRLATAQLEGPADLISAGLAGDSRLCCRIEYFQRDAADQQQRQELGINFEQPAVLGPELRRQMLDIRRAKEAA